MITVLAAGPCVTVQDAGRIGLMAQGLSRGGAADARALDEGWALLGQPGAACLELAGYGGRFRLHRATRVALTGADMVARVGDRVLPANTALLLPAGAVIDIGAARSGAYGYLHVGGGIITPQVLGSRAAHLVAGIGRRLGPGDTLPLGDDQGGPVDVTIDVAPRCGGGELRLVASVQTGLFAPATRDRFVATMFLAGRGDRMGLALRCDGDGFAADGQRSLVSEVIVPGDVQMTGTGAPFVLLAECQTTGGYPRIGAVIPPDLPRAAQAAPGDVLRFRFVSMPEALAALARDRAEIAALAPRPLRRVLDTATLITAQLVGGVVDAHADFLVADPFAKEP